MRLIPALVFLAVFCFPIILSAQTVSIKGKVWDDMKQSIPFAVVAEKGTKNAVSANESGDFSIKLMKVPCVLVVTAVGFQSAEYKVTNENRNDAFKIILKRSTASLDEVVVTGFSRVEKNVMAGEAVKIGRASCRERV